MIYLIRYGELAVKGESVRREFENVLVNNIKSLEGNFVLTKERGRIIIESDADITDQLSHTFGIVSFSKADRFFIETLEDIKKNLNLHFDGSFAVRVRRVGFPGKSTDIERELGAYVVEKTGAKVDLTTPDNTIDIEIRNNTCYIFRETYSGLGGLPLGTSERVYSSLKNEDDVKAALMMMKRGCTIATDGDRSKIEDYHKGQEITRDGWVAKISTDKLKDIKKGDKLTFWPLIGSIPSQE